MNTGNLSLPGRVNDEAVVPDHEDDDNKDHDGGAVVDAIDRMLALEEIAQLKGFKC